MYFSWKIVAAVLGIIAFITIMLVLIFGGNNNTGTSNVNRREQLALHDYATRGGAVSFTSDGNVNAVENHRIIKISVSGSVRSVEVLDGYSGSILKRQDFTNDEAAFEVFLTALERSGFQRERKTPDTNIVAQCPLGIRYSFTTISAPDDKTLWTTSCGRETGTFGGAFGSVQQLFQKQIPDYSKFVSGVNLNM